MPDRLLFSTIILIIFLLTVQGISNAQIKPLDTAVFNNRIDLLQRKLTFTYNNPDQEKWYINRFFYDEDTKKVTLKNISSKSPNAIRGKYYQDRIFLLKDINPFTIDMEEVKQNQGRIVKGKLVRLKTKNRQPLVEHKVNGKPASPQSFASISLPSYMDDSIATFSDSVKIYFEELTFTASLFSQEDAEELNVMDLFVGKHEISSLDKLVIRNTEKVSEQLALFQDLENDEIIGTGTYFIDAENKNFKIVTVSTSGTVKSANFKLVSTTSGLKLKDKDGGNFFIVSPYYFYLKNGDSITEYKSITSFVKH